MCGISGTLPTSYKRIIVPPLFLSFLPVLHIQALSVLNLAERTVRHYEFGSIDYNRFRLFRRCRHIRGVPTFKMP